MRQGSLDNCRREYYRLRYPVRNRPTLSLSNQTYHVAEISERGLRFCRRISGDEFEVGKMLVGKLSLSATNLEIRGRVKRRDGDEIVVVDVEGISFGCVLDEQRRIAGAYLILDS